MSDNIFINLSVMKEWYNKLPDFMRDGGAADIFSGVGGVGASMCINFFK